MRLLFLIIFINTYAFGSEHYLVLSHAPHHLKLINKYTKGVIDMAEL